MVRKENVQPKHPGSSPHWTQIWVFIIKKCKYFLTVILSKKNEMDLACAELLIEKDDNSMRLKLVKGKYPVDIFSSNPM
jgi:hypothetical protein